MTPPSVSSWPGNQTPSRSAALPQRGGTEKGKTKGILPGTVKGEESQHSPFCRPSPDRVKAVLLIYYSLTDCLQILIVGSLLFSIAEFITTLIVDVRTSLLTSTSPRPGYTKLSIQAYDYALQLQKFNQHLHCLILITGAC